MKEDKGNVTEKKKPMTHEERMALAEKLDKELDDFIAGLEKRSYTEGWPEDRWEEEMEKHPFFMKNLPEDGTLPPLVEGIQQLKYDENENTPLELATSYKEDGNFNFKYKKYRMAIISYTEGIKTNCGDNAMEAQLYGNRSAAQFYLGNYRSSLNDCQKALKKDPNNLKVKLRAGKCCVRLKLFKEALAYCDEILEKNPEEQNAIQIRKEAITAQKVEERDLRRKECVEKILQSKREAIKIALEKRNIKLDMDEEDIDESLKLAGQKPVLEDDILSWPVYFLYPENSMSDLIEQFNENSTFMEHFEEMFVVPPDWDPEFNYRPENLSIYFEGYDRSTVYPVNPSHTLKSVLSSGKFYVRDWKPSFLVFVRGSEAEAKFLQNYKILA